MAIGLLDRLGSFNYGHIFLSLLDIAVVAFVFYKLIMLVKGTRAWQIIWGLGLFFLLVFVSDLLNLRALRWLLDIFLPLGPVALVILFFPELRHLLEEAGRLNFLGRGFVMLRREDITNLVDALTDSVAKMSSASVGALIVVEREVGLDNVIANGNRMDSAVTSELLRTIFHPGSPMHDGAVIIRGNRIVASGCTLPLSDSPRLGTMIHTRHKAALGVSEQSDAAVLVVSEETGLISLSVDGTLLRGLSPQELHVRLLDLLNAGEVREGVLQFRRTMSNAFSRVWQGGQSGRDKEG
ncbi:MAG: diadenylate cyclase CdaA [Armatimonadota bacterium]